MTELDDTALMVFRGQYSTLRAKHEDAVRELQMTAGRLTSLTAQILKTAQDDTPSVTLLIDDARALIEDMQQATERIEHLAKQKAELRPLAWPKKKAEAA